MLTQKFIRKYGFATLNDEFGIKCKFYDDRVVLNYSQIESPKFNSIVKECRGLILSNKAPYNVISRSFDRFYNYNEDQNTKLFNITNSICFSKEDGTLINVYHDGQKLCIATRYMAFAEGNVNMDDSLSYNDLVLQTDSDIFKKIEQIHDFEKYTFIFELCTPYNRVVKRYTDNRLFLLAIRNKFTGEYLPENLINTFSFRRPKIYSFKSYDEISKSMKNLPVLDEGYVCYDEKLNWRIKIKNPSYLAVAHIRDMNGLSIKRIVHLVWENEHEEYLSYFPEDRPLFQKYIDAYNNMMEDIDAQWNKYRHIKDRKEFAIAIKNLPIKDILFHLYSGKSLTNKFKNVTSDYKIKLLKCYMKRG